jgi:hypothetical protein
MPWTTAAPTTIHRAEVKLAPDRARQTTTTPAIATPLPATFATVSRSPSAAAAIATLMSGADATTMLAGPAGT